ncbi:MAG: hypothetical protein EXS05_05765 [Planctomycetaceae bacterium]|nr:hypothetical protein [Planctomycetaceae bacterium]
MQALSVHEEGLREAKIHKWIESQKRGRDLGVWALDDWYTHYWPIFCRLKCLEHLAGIRSWSEFSPEKFGLIGKLIRDEDQLLEMILDRAYSGRENLDLVNWALDWGLPMKRVGYILEQLNLNQAQLEPGAPPHVVEQLNTPSEFEQLAPPQFARPRTFKSE